MPPQPREPAIGKRVVDDLYLHLSALQALAPAQAEPRQRIEQALQRLPAGGQRGLPDKPRIPGCTHGAPTAALPGSLGCVDIRSISTGRG